MSSLPELPYGYILYSLMSFWYCMDVLISIYYDQSDKDCYRDAIETGWVPYAAAFLFGVLWPIVFLAQLLRLARR